MSCNHPESHPEMNHPAKGGTIVLTKNDLYKIRTGKILEYHFHGSQFHFNRLTFFVTNEASKVTKDSKLGRKAMMIGEACPIVIDKEEMKILQIGKDVLGRQIPCEPPFEIIICTSEQYQRLVKNTQEKKL